MSEPTSPSRRRDHGARAIAARVLERVGSDDAYAAAVLDAELGRAEPLDPRDRALATTLVYATLRAERALDAALKRLAPKGLKDGFVRVHLLVAACQLQLLERVPAHAAVDAAVEAISARRGSRVGAFANAVLRKLAQEPRPTAEALASAALPSFLAPLFPEGWTPAATLALLGLDDMDPAVTLRLTGAAPEWVDAESEPGRFVPQARRLVGRGDPRRRPGYHDGAFAVQEEGAQLVGLAVGVEPGHRVLDACAGRGQKTAQLSAALAGRGELWATDVHAPKLQALVEEHARLRLPLPHTLPLDLTVGQGALVGPFDRILVDVPCTGLGTVRHRPEILRRLTADAPARLSAIAEAIVRRAATLLAPDGVLLFSTCSVLPVEGEALVERVQDVLAPAPLPAPVCAMLGLADGATSFRLAPHTHGTDGYFAASLRLR